ncbi:hypothetical protein BBAL3_938 [Brevundimonas sp. BAL3]|nr:hypothetical protein BBAL3_938 [Brevundimonas sp. BAL3]
MKASRANHSRIYAPATQVRPQFVPLQHLGQTIGSVSQTERASRGLEPPGPLRPLLA